MDPAASSEADRNFMRETFILALRGAGRASPNPLVGAVLVDRGRVVCGGWHHAFGEAHAEVDCLQRLHGSARGMTLYVNLEPCSHFGKTPPCADALIEAGLARVVVAMRDPNPLVAGRGIRRLRRAGMEVVEGVLEDEARFLNRFFLTHILERRPYVHLKVAQTLDGKIAGGQGGWISSLPSRRLVHRWRSTHDAVLVGAGTVQTDRPDLTVRLVKGRHPAVVVLDGRLSLRPQDLRFPHGPTVTRPLRAGAGRSSSGAASGVSRAMSRRVILCTSAEALQRQASRARQIAREGVEVVGFPSGKDGHLRLKGVLEELYCMGIGSILVEGGGRVFSDFTAEGIIDEFSSFTAPKVYGDGLGAFSPLATGSAGSGLTGIPDGSSKQPKRRRPAPDSGKIPMRTITVYNSGGDVLIRAFRQKYTFTDLAVGS